MNNNKNVPFAVALAAMNGMVADLEPVARGLHVCPENADVRLIQTDDGFVANHVVVGGDNLGEDVGFGAAQRRSTSLDPRLGGAH